jgi:hypothetical protein
MHAMRPLLHRGCLFIAGLALIACDPDTSSAPADADARTADALGVVTDALGVATDALGEPGPEAPARDAVVPDASPPDAEVRPPDAAALPPAPDAHPRFRFGIADADRHKMMPNPVFHVDHDPETHPEARATCTNYAGQHFPFCYDDHSGSDFMLGGGFSTMDNGSAEVVAAAAGVVVTAEDGHYDRCHGSAATLDVTCDGNEMRPNYVRLRHANGWTSLYFHLKKGSVAVVEGQRVACGERLGLVGSSGVSTLPHLHFQVEDPAGEVFDPFSGPESQPESLFTEQVSADGLPGAACDPAWSAPLP